MRQNCRIQVRIVYAFKELSNIWRVVFLQLGKINKKLANQVSSFPKNNACLLRRSVKVSEDFFVETQSRRSFVSMRCAILYRHMQAPIMRDGDLEENLNG